MDPDHHIEGEPVDVLERAQPPDRQTLKDALAATLSGPVPQRPLSFRASSGAAVIQVSTSSGVVRITGIAFERMTPIPAFGSVIRNAKMPFAVSPSLTFQLLPRPAKQAGRAVLVASELDAPPAALLNSLQGVERHDAAVLGAEPAGAVFALLAADVGGVPRPAPLGAAR
jgi:hypothetical protein